MFQKSIQLLKFDNVQNEQIHFALECENRVEKYLYFVLLQKLFQFI